MKTALLPGSFDPITLGHVDVIRRASKLFDRVLVVAMVNESKHYMLSMEERLMLIKAAIEDIPNVTVDAWEGMLFEYARAHGVDAIVKGVRSEKDFAYELLQANFNKEHYEGVDTVFFPALGRMKDISSSDVRRMLHEGLDISTVVHQKTLEFLIEKRNEGK